MLDFLSTWPSLSSLLTLSLSAILCTSIVTTSVLHPVTLGAFLGFLHAIPLHFLEGEVEDWSQATGAALPAGKRGGNAWGFVTPGPMSFLRCEV